MRCSRLPLFVLALAAVALNGCGTVANLAADKPRYFGGLDNDGELLGNSAVEDGIGCVGAAASPLLPAVAAVCFTEVVCTSVADVLTLPLVWAFHTPPALPKASRSPDNEPPQTWVEAVQASPVEGPPSSFAALLLTPQAATPSAP